MLYVLLAGKIADNQYKLVAAQPRQMAVGIGKTLQATADNAQYFVAGLAAKTFVQQLETVQVNV